MGKKSGIRETDEKRAGCGILVKKGRECGIRTPPSRPSEMWFRKLKLKLLAGAYLTVIQLSTGLKYFWAFFFEWPNWKKKSQSFFVCFHVTNVCQEHCWWHAAPQDRALLSSYTIVLSKYRQMSQDCVQGSMGMLSLAQVLAVVIACVQTSSLPQEKSGEETSVNRRR